MRDMTAFWWKPRHQPSETPVEFHVKPLDMPTRYEVSTSLVGRSAPTWEVMERIFLRNVIDWRGLPDECTAAVKRRIIESGEVQWDMWLAELVGDLYRRSILPEDAAKN